MSLSEVSVSAGTYRGDRNWSDQFIPEVKKIVGQYLLATSDIKQDMAEATDLIVLCAQGMRIAVRMRRPGAAEKYPWDFTIRRSRTNGARTEMAKIVDGWGDWLFYGHAATLDSCEICRWWLVDLRAWRSHMIRSENTAGKPDTRANRNDGGKTRLTAFNLRYFTARPPILIAGSHPAPPPEVDRYVTRTERLTMGGYGIRSS